MNYLIIGTGGVAGSTASALAQGNHEVTCICHGDHLEALQRDGLTLRRSFGNSITTPVTALSMDNYLTQVQAGKLTSPDVIILGVRGYSLKEATDFIVKLNADNALILPLMNPFDARAQVEALLVQAADALGTPHEALPLVLDGCIYVVARMIAPGVVRQSGSTHHIVFGTRNKSAQDDRVQKLLYQLAYELSCAPGMTCELADQPEREVFKKFCFYSPFAALSVYYSTDASSLQVPGEQREGFCQLVKEVASLGRVLGYELPADIESWALGILDQMAPSSTNSLFRDMQTNRPTELHDLIEVVCDLADKHGLETPFYHRIASRFTR